MGMIPLKQTMFSSEGEQGSVVVMHPDGWTIMN